MTQVRKRDGSLQEFDAQKITAAMQKAFDAVDVSISEGNLYDLTTDATLHLKLISDDPERIVYPPKVLDIEYIQDTVEQVLMRKWPKVGKAYVLYRAEHGKLRKEKAAYKADSNAIADYIHPAKYAKYLPREKRRETFIETSHRSRDMHKMKYPYLSEIITEIWTQFVDTKRVLPSMRSMQFAGAQIVRHNASLYNCLGDQTKFITDKGVLSFENCEDGQQITVLTHKGNWKPAIVRCYGKDELFELKFVRGRSEITVYATKNHRWPLVDGNFTDNLSLNDRVIIGPNLGAIFYPYNNKNSTLEEKKDWCKGFAYGDGSFIKGRYTSCYLRLCGNKTKYLDIFEEAGYEHSYPSSHDDPVIKMRDLSKVLPENPSLAWISGWLAADGSVDEDGRFRGIQTTGLSSVEWLRKWLPKFGFYILLEEDLTNQETNFGTRSDVTISFRCLRQSSNQGFIGWTLKAAKSIGKQDVWCLEVEDDNSFVLSQGISTGNCSYSLIDRPRVFQEVFYLLLCGCGVGYSVQKQHVAKLPKLSKIDRTRVRHFMVDDTIEGWSDAVGALINGHITGHYVEFSYSLIRPEGSILNMGGGKAPGHLPLKTAIEKIRRLLYEAEDRQLRPLEAHDILCFIAEAVLAGGIRRSSLISLFSLDDEEMLYCKTPKYFRYRDKSDPGLNSQREMANNSAVFLRYTFDERQFREVININQSNPYGEPGFIFVNHLDYGCNPCGEIGLYPVYDGKTGFQFCNLCEINASVFTKPEDFYGAAKAAAFIGTLQAGYTDFPYLGSTTEQITKRDALLGVGLTGIMDCPDIALDPDCQRHAASIAAMENQKTAAWIGIKAARRVTTVKPSGTASLELGGISSGIHPRHAKRYFRRVTANHLEPIALHFKSVNPHMVEEKPNGDLSLVFPMEAPTGAKTGKETSALDLMKAAISTYENWVLPGTIDDSSLTHNVSLTVMFRPEEWNSLVNRIILSRNKIAAMSFYPVSSDKGIPFVPHEEVVTELDEERWRYYVKHYKPVDYSKMTEDYDTTQRMLEAACAGGSCDIDEVRQQTKAHGVCVLYEKDIPYGAMNRIEHNIASTKINFAKISPGMTILDASSNRFNRGWVVLEGPFDSADGMYVIAAWTRPTEVDMKA